MMVEIKAQCPVSYLPKNMTEAFINSKCGQIDAFIMVQRLQARGIACFDSNGVEFPVLHEVALVFDHLREKLLEQVKSNLMQPEPNDVELCELRAREEEELEDQLKGRW